MNEEEILKLIHTLIGETEPVGDTGIDYKRKENVKKLISIMKGLHSEIDDIVNKHGNSMYSSKRDIAEECNKYLDWLGITNN